MHHDHALVPARRLAEELYRRKLTPNRLSLDSHVPTAEE